MGLGPLAGTSSCTTSSAESASPADPGHQDPGPLRLQPASGREGRFGLQERAGGSRVPGIRSRSWSKREGPLLT